MPYALPSKQFLLLAGLLALTRFDHFAPIPDASLAVFVLGGLWVGGGFAFAALFALAFGVDVLAVGLDEARAYCMTPAYWGLLPTYGLLWLAGRHLARQANPFAWTRLLAVSTTAFSLAFVMSNLSWWLLSPRFDLPFVEFWQAVARYYPAYLGGALLWLLLSTLLAQGIRARRAAAV